MADLMTALRNADAAGDTEAAQRIAAMIQAQGMPAASSQAQPGMLQQLARQVGLAGRYGLEGAGNLVGTVTDPFMQFVPGSMPMGQSAGALADAVGLPKPQTNLEKDVAGASKALVGTGLTAGAGSALGAAELAAQPTMQALSAMFGGGAQESAKNAGASEGGQALAGALGSLSAGIPAGLTGLAKTALRGGSAGQQRMLDNIAAFEAAGSTPTVGQATEGGIARGIESILAKIPGGSGIMARKAQTQAGELGANIDQLVPQADPTEAGLAIQQGITGQGGFLDRFKTQSKSLYDAVDSLLPNGTEGTTIGVPATLSKFFQLTKPISGAENISGLLADPKIGAMAQAMQNDVRNSVAATGQASLPYQSIKDLRSMIGDKIADAGLAPDVSTRQLKQLYGSLSEDMRNGLQGISPEAYAANNQAENFVRNGHDQIDKIERIVGNNGGAEGVFKAATAGTGQGASTLNNVMSALQPDEQNVVASAIVRKLGQATDANQNAAGDVFSPQTFLTNWNKLDPRAKNVLFQANPDLKANLDQVANVASNIREGSKYLANPSGTSNALMHGTAMLGAIQALATGNLPELGAIGAGMGTANIGARLMTNPDFVKWLARNATAPVGVLPAQVGYLSNLGAKNNDPDLTRAAQIIGQGLP